MKKRILILGASDFQLPAIKKAKEMGLYVGVADMNPNAVGVPYADRFFEVSTIDEQGVLAAAQSMETNGVMTLATDMPMRALAYTCEKMALTGLDYATAVRATDKGEMIRAFAAHGVAHPAFCEIAPQDDWREKTKGFDFPVITKPVDNSGSRGIMLVENIAELEQAIEYSRKSARRGNVLVEEYMRGPEVSVEIVVVEGNVHVLQITDKLTTGAPHFVEIGHSQPSGLSEKVQGQIRDLATQAVKAIGIQNGPAHVEIIVTDKGPKMVELGARMGGGCITTHLVPLSTGVDMIKATIDASLSNEPELASTLQKGSAIRFIIPPKGEVVSVEGKEEAEAIPGVILVELQCRPGQILGELESGASRIGYVIAQAENAEAAVKICEKALEKIKISTK